MILAVPYENGDIFQHFGHTEFFKLYEIENGAVQNSRIVPTLGSGHGALAGVLQALGAEAIICGGIGMGARNALSQAGIRVFAGVSGSADKAADAYAAGRLEYDPDANCDHHEHHEGDCGHDHCEDHNCKGN